MPPTQLPASIIERDRECEDSHLSSVRHKPGTELASHVTSHAYLDTKAATESVKAPSGEGILHDSFEVHPGPADKEGGSVMSQTYSQTAKSEQVQGVYSD